MQQAYTWLIWCNQDIFWFKTKLTPETRFCDLFISLDLPGAAGLSNAGSRPLRCSPCAEWQWSLILCQHTVQLGRQRQAAVSHYACGWCGCYSLPPKTQRRRWHCQVPGLPFWCCVKRLWSTRLRPSSLFRSGFYENTLASHEKTKKLSYQSVISEVRRWRTVAFTMLVIIIFSILKW